MSDKPIISGTFTADDVVKLLEKSSASNNEALKEFAKELAFKIAHPDPTDRERQALLRRIKDEEDLAREREADKAALRHNCSHLAQPGTPHRRIGAQWGMFNGSSVIAWQISTATRKDPNTGRSFETQPFPIGVCMWCGTEFRPGDPDYQEALSWGINAIAGTADMNVRNGTWING